MSLLWNAGDFWGLVKVRRSAGTSLTEPNRVLCAKLVENDISRERKGRS